MKTYKWSKFLTVAEIVFFPGTLPVPSSKNQDSQVVLMYLSAPLVERLCFETFSQGGVSVDFKLNSLAIEAKIAYIGALAYFFLCLHKTCLCSRVSTCNAF